jgi:hypothetical protein
MAANPTSIDISNMPDVMRVAEEVEATRIPRILQRHKKTIAILMPIEPASTAKNTV